MVWKKVEKLEVRAVGQRGNWNLEKMLNDLKNLEKGFYEVSIDDFMAEYYEGDWKKLKQPVLRAKAKLQALIEENKLKIAVYGSPKQGKLGIRVQ